MWENALHNNDNENEKNEKVRKIREDIRKKEIHIAKVLADAGDKVIFLPEINPLSDGGQKLRKLTLPKGVNEGKSPDAFINGKHIVEFKTSNTNTSKSVRNLLTKGSKQADIVCLKLTGEAPEYFKKTLKGYANVSKRIKGVWLIDQNAKLVK